MVASFYCLNFMTETKVEFFDTSVFNRVKILPLLLCGSEYWTLTKGQIRKEETE